jgi:biotin operon repressor
VSNHLISEVYKRQLGSMARNAVMVLLADKASDDGTGIWASKQRMADELGASKQTVISTIKGLVLDGLLRETGQRKCTNGFTIEYAIDVEALKALALVGSHDEQKGNKGSTDLTGQTALPVKEADLTGQAALPDGSSTLTQTPLNPPEPPLDKSASADAPLTIEEVVEDWNALALACGLPVVRKITPARRRAFKARLREYPDIADWRRAFLHIRNTPWLLGENARGWRANFKFLLQAESFTNLTEEAYGQAQRRAA